ncbi:MAG TPA: APC family permease, partial [bacterium]|nr:APC family permease [bacterium]
HLESVQDKGTAILTGAVLAFYAFIGFEDMANVSEEVREPQRIFPKAILSVLVIIGVIYILTALAAVSVVSPEELSHSKAPLITVVQKGAPWFPPGLFTWIALFAVTNTALANYVMGTRLLYGMARDGTMPRFLGHVNPNRHTPDAAVVSVFVMVLALALTGTITRLAQSTAFLLLIVFFMINLSLIIIKLKTRGETVPFEVPMIIPVFGVLTTFGLAFYVSGEAVMTVAILVAVALTFFLFRYFNRSAKGRM